MHNFSLFNACKSRSVCEIKMGWSGKGWIMDYGTGRIMDQDAPFQFVHCLWNRKPFCFFSSFSSPFLYFIILFWSNYLHDNSLDQSQTWMNLSICVFESWMDPLAAKKNRMNPAKVNESCIHLGTGTRLLTTARGGPHLASLCGVKFWSFSYWNARDTWRERLTEDNGSTNHKKISDGSKPMHSSYHPR
jgi:hypothetical protein